MPKNGILTVHRFSIAACVLLTVSATAASGAPHAPAAARPICQSTAAKAAADAKPLRAHPMTEEPNAREILTVLRTIDGCSRPVVIRDDVGAEPRR